MGKNLRVCELFAGIGGFTLGLSRSGWNTVYANQFEPSTKIQHAADLFKKNFPNIYLENKDINLIDYKSIKNHDLLVAGFPCQDYSVATTKAKGIEGKKGVLWWNIHGVVKEKKPKYILLENVDRLLKSPSIQRGRDFAIILATLRDLGYFVEWRVINASDYGFPQKRTRIFIFAINQKTDFALEMKSGSNNPERFILKDGFFSSEFKALPKETNYSFDFNNSLEFNNDVDEISMNFGKNNKKFRFSNSGFMVSYGKEKYKIFHMQVNSIKEKKKITLRDILEKKVSDNYFITEESIGRKKNLNTKRRNSNEIPIEEKRTWLYQKNAKKEYRTKKVIINDTDNKQVTYNYDMGRVPFPDNLDSPSRTLLTNEGSKSPNRTTHVILDEEKNKLRLLTPIECEKLNGFRKNWTKIQGITDRKRYYLLGNSLVVGLIEKMGKRLKEISNKKSEPILRWAGGKRQLLDKLNNKIPKNFNNYFEPFFGAGAMFFNLNEKKLLKGKKIYLSDFNEHLILFYQTIKKSPSSFIENFNKLIFAEIQKINLEIDKQIFNMREDLDNQLKDEKNLKKILNHLSKKPKKNSDLIKQFLESQNKIKNFYEDIRSWDKSKNWKNISNIDKSCRFLFLNKTCFNGLWRVNKNNQFNVPIDISKRFFSFNPSTIIKCSKSFQNSELLYSNYTEVIKKIKKNDFIYFDPPYFPVKKNSFLTYTNPRFDSRDHYQLKEICDKIHKKGAFFLLSNSDVPQLHELYKKYRIDEVDARRSVNSDGEGRGVVKELLISNYDS